MLYWLLVEQARHENMSDEYIKTDIRYYSCRYELAFDDIVTIVSCVRWLLFLSRNVSHFLFLFPLC